ncbi:MAG: hypothetical protein A2104_09775 [Candidatus Melainabacteria bacterium GWF2_32_7]|nr:MAG: hypothetical protein A2104_09775 [Candidatus Melainabacteria bacterium GWF2_32_7]
MQKIIKNKITIIIFSICLCLFTFLLFGANKSYSKNPNILAKGITHKKIKRYLHGKPAILNVIIVDSKNNNTVKPSYGSYFLNALNNVKEITHLEDAIAGINASFFKPDSGIPLGTSVIDKKVITGPLYKRVALGITSDKKYYMQKIDIVGNINIGEKTKLSLFNINQPVFSKYRFTIFTDQWGRSTPKTSNNYIHAAIKNGKIKNLKTSSISIPKGGFVIVGPHKLFPKVIGKQDEITYSVKLIPDKWNDMQYAIGGGPFLVKNGKKFIDRQNFTSAFLWTKLPRTAIGYTKAGTLVIVTIDGYEKGITDGATMSELSQIMWDYGCYNAMNLDGGTSTQMVIKGKLVNYSKIKDGYKVTNALVIIAPILETQNLKIN